MPIVGSFAGASARAYGLGAGGALLGDFESIATITAGSAVPSIEFTSIPASYTHLQIRGLVRVQSSGNVDGDNLKIQFNGDTATNYSRHSVYGNGTSALSYGLANNIISALALRSSAAANNFSFCILDILDYANTNKYKTTRVLSGYDNNGSGTAPGQVGLYSGNWRSTSAITSIKLTTDADGTNLLTNSTFALYGIKA
jgi:hypothetical protein